MNLLGAFNKLDSEVQHALQERVLFRKNRFLNVLRNEYPEIEVLIVGDRPANTALKDLAMQFTPFGGLWHSSLFLNLALETGSIDESRLTWINSSDFNGKSTPYDILKKHWPLVISLGGNAKRWLYQSTHPILNTVDFPHPSYWKRFHSKKPYALIEFLQIAGCVEPKSGTPKIELV